MGEQLPILKGILKGNFSYHNARKFYSKFNSNSTEIIFQSDHLEIGMISQFLTYLSVRYDYPNRSCEVISPNFQNLNGTQI